MRALAAILLSLTASSGVLAQTAPTTVNNDDSCDIGVYPAATLLLPHFEVDVANPGRTTIFNVTNVSPLPQIVRVTLWTDYGFPVLNFNLFLSGYDVQPINLYDVFARGLIGGTTGTSTSAPNARESDGTPTNPNIGMTPLTNLANPNFLPTAAANCGAGRLPGALPSPLIDEIRSIFLHGRGTGAFISCPLPSGVQAPLGGNHGASTATGYATIDVVATCAATFPTDPAYFSSELLYDNVLTGDYEQINTDTTTGNYAGGNPMVHIRAVPEGGGVGSVPTGVTSLPFTFYDRLTVGATDRRVDRRQPLPSAFATRWISGTTAAFETEFLIWREALTGRDAACTAHWTQNSNMTMGELVRFDERENASIFHGTIVIPEQPVGGPTLPATSRVAVTSVTFPEIATTDGGGWLYMNLSNGGITSGGAYSAAREGFGAVRSRNISQNWVVVSMFAEGRYNASFDATALGNGCTAGYAATSSATDIASPRNHIGPAGGVVVCAPGTVPTNGDSAACRGSNLNP